ncbi:hypothetical protein LIER_30273 [Lithospermum erythrorhizon]|uniref:BUD13 homolog n=1 Tax=Lithospermum erythrorhizon TaxID=34254 RepID=A0AAV3RP96_LITER
MDSSPLKKNRKQSTRACASDNNDDLSPHRSMKKVTTFVEKERQLKTGLVSGQDIKQEILKTKEQEWLMFKNLDHSVSGRGAQPVYRNKTTGERVTKEEFLKFREEKKKKQEERKEIKPEWDTGLVQKCQAEEELKEPELEKAEPFARTRDDPELEKRLKERVRFELENSDKMKESGCEIPQKVTSPSWMTEGIVAPPNRYGIKPGTHWDGVDRSTGFENDCFNRINERQAVDEEAYKWS